jgi:hypothetical protein
VIRFVRIDTTGHAMGGTFVDWLVEYARRGGDTFRRLEAEVRRAEVLRCDSRWRMSIEASRVVTPSPPDLPNVTAMEDR